MNHPVLFQFEEKLVAFNHLYFVLKQKRRTQNIQGDYCLCLLKMDNFWMEAGAVEISHQYKHSHSSALCFLTSFPLYCLESWSPSEC